MSARDQRRGFSQEEYDADEKVIAALEESLVLPHQRMYTQEQQYEAYRNHPDYLKFPNNILNETKWRKTSCAAIKLKDLVERHIVTKRTTINDLRNDLGGGKWYFWNYTDAIVKNYLQEYLSIGKTFKYTNNVLILQKILDHPK